jgi:cell wall-associated NlpC family hydrolase
MIGVFTLKLFTHRALIITISSVSVAAAGSDISMNVGTTADDVVQQTIANVSGQDFSDFYTNEYNYKQVYRNVMSWFGGTSNGCVAFASTALRFLGVNVPQNGLWNGERVSLLTKPFSAYLQDKLGWTRVTQSKELRPGDLVFTVDEPKAPGYPAHVFMHAGYEDAARLISLAVDNQEFTHPRALAGDVKKDYSAFAYALRSPID